MFVTSTKIGFSIRDKNICNGVGATATVLKKFLHPKKFIGGRYSKIVPQEGINNLVVVRKGTKPIKSKLTTVIFFHYNYFPNDSIYTSYSYFKVLNERYEANFFDNCIHLPPQEDTKAGDPTGEYQEEERGILFGGSD